MALAGLVLASVPAQPALAQRAVAVPAHKSPSAPIPELASHRAVYDISLVTASQRDGVRTASGTTTFVLTDRCDGYTVESVLNLELGLATGSDSVVQQRYASWEAKDNRFASFRMFTREDGKPAVSYQGTVKLDDTGAGTATYEREKPTIYSLPPGTLLSTRHMATMLAAAARGEVLVNRTVIDGSFDDGPYRITAVAGPQSRSAMLAADKGGLTMAPSRPIAFAYFPLESSDALPSYEVTMTLHPNGVARRLVQDFGGFTLAFDLVRVEPVTAAICK